MLTQFHIIIEMIDHRNLPATEADNDDVDDLKFRQKAQATKEA